jgi:hypothetical protein
VVGIVCFLPLASIEAASHTQKEKISVALFRQTKCVGLTRAQHVRPAELKRRDEVFARGCLR